MSKGRGENLVFVEDMRVVLLIKFLSSYILANPTLWAREQTILVLAFKMHTIEWCPMDTGMRQTFWDRVGMGPREF